MRELSIAEVEKIGGAGIYTQQNMDQFRNMAIGAAAGAITGGPIGAAVGLVAGALTGVQWSIR